MHKARSSCSAVNLVRLCSAFARQGKSKSESLSRASTVCCRKGAPFGRFPRAIPKLATTSLLVQNTTRYPEIKVTTFPITLANGNTLTSYIDTCNEKILLQGTTATTWGACWLLHHHDPRVPLSRIVAGQTPSRHVDRVPLDHKNRNTLDNRAVNLNWVRTTFNPFKGIINSVFVRRCYMRSWWLV